MGKCPHVHVVFAILGVVVFPGTGQGWNSDKYQ